MRSVEKKKMAAVIVPGYVFIWFAITACGSGSGILEDFQALCSSGSQGLGAAVSSAAADGVELERAFGGDVVFGEVDVTVPKNKRQEILRTTFALPFTVPAGDVTLSGQFDPFSFAPDKAAKARPRKILTFISHHDEEGERQQQIRIPLNVRGDEINQRKKAYSEMVLERGHQLRVDVRPKGADLSLEEQIQLFYTLSPDTKSLASLLRLFAGDSVPGIGIPSAVRAGKKQEVLTTRLGVDTPLEKSTVVLSGGFLESGSRSSSAARRPRRIVFFLDHLDADGDRKGRFRIVAKVTGSTIDRTTKPFRGFDVKAGESLRLTFKPRGGDFEAGERFFLSLTTFQE